MTNRAKAKGSTGEYQVRDLLQPIVDEVYHGAGRAPPILERNLEQVRHGGADLVGLPWLAIEVKRRETLSVGAWWQQVQAAAAPTGAVPVLIYRQNHAPWRVVMFGSIGVFGSKLRVRAPVEISLDAFQTWFKLELEQRVFAETGKLSAGA